MEIPENLREIVDRLGVALVKALANDESSRALVQEIQAYGFDMALMLEATVALHKREDGEDGAEDAAEGFDGPGAETGFSLDQDRGQWSEEDKAFLKTFKISLE
ncbi:MAG: hypothetical protein P4L36_03530 [Holophaga sp.]|nr:hypothetical protein [Holophaga sp.]